MREKKNTETKSIEIIERRQIRWKKREDVRSSDGDDRSGYIPE